MSGDSRHVIEVVKDLDEWLPRMLEKCEARKLERPLRSAGRYR
jgi:hypothetical protein